LEDGIKINNNNKSKTSVLLAPLDWGLGHTTRCFPIIKRLLLHDIDVLVACNAEQAKLIHKDFPSVFVVPLEGYKLKYGTHRISTILTIVLQIPKILIAINRERNWLKDFIQSHKMNAVISDSRFGMCVPGLHSIFMTHQLKIKSPLGKWTENILQKLNYSFINKFSECWVIDFEENGLAGELSHTNKLPNSKTKFIGAVSRFQRTEDNDDSIDLLVILSGPEPQRSIFEKIIRENLESFKGIVAFAKGTLSTSEMQELFQKSKYVISRTGYTTVMDIVAMRKKSILVPTPGQSEQEYLGKYLTENKIALCISQSDFDLQSAMKEASNFQYADLSKFDFSEFEKKFDNFLVDQDLLRR